jgi:hypothetical protein
MGNFDNCRNRLHEKHGFSWKKRDFDGFARKISILIEKKDVLTSFANRYKRIKVHKAKM